MTSALLLLLSAMPTYVASGASTVTASATTCQAGAPAGIVADDIIISVACGEGDGTGSIALGTANGFTVGTGAPVSGDDGDGTEETTENDCSYAWLRSDGSDTMPVWADSGDHTTCQNHLFRGVRTTGNPWTDDPVGSFEATSDNSASITGLTTTTADNLIVLVQGTSNNATATTNCGSVTNADLANILEKFDSSNTSGLGSGHCIIVGEKAAAGSVGASTLTMGANTMKAMFAIPLEGAVVIPPTGCGTTTLLTGAGC
jgi:hypothetical protein